MTKKTEEHETAPIGVEVHVLSPTKNTYIAPHSRAYTIPEHPSSRYDAHTGRRVDEGGEININDVVKQMAQLAQTVTPTAQIVDM